MSASESRKVFEELARRIGLEGEEFTAWVDAREAARLQEEKERLEFEREMEEEERELEEMRLRTLELKLRLADVEKARMEKLERSETPCNSTCDEADEVCYIGSTWLKEGSGSLFGCSIGPYHSLSMGSEPELEDSVEVDSRETGMGSKVLGEAEASFASLEQGSSTNVEGYSGASRGLSVVDEERVPHKISSGEDLLVCPDEDNECSCQEYRAMATYTTGVPSAAVTHNESMVLEDHRDNLPPGRLRLAAHESADGDLSDRKRNGLNGRVENVQESTAKVREPHLENPSTLDVRDTSSIESAAFSRASYGSECVSPEVSDALPALQLQESVEIHEEVIRTQLVSYAWWQGRSFECNLSLYAACKVTWRWRVFRRSYRWAFGPTRFRVSIGLVFRRLESAIRLVWDAIT